MGVWASATRRRRPGAPPTHAVLAGSTTRVRAVCAPYQRRPRSSRGRQSKEQSVTSNAIEAEVLVKRFGATQALAGIDLTARKGTVLGVLGPNGAGKTTAVRILATLL